MCSKCGSVVVEQIICGISELRTYADDRQAYMWKRSRYGDTANRFLSSGVNLSTSIRPAEGHLAVVANHRVPIHSLPAFYNRFNGKVSIMASIMV